MVAMFYTDMPNVTVDEDGFLYVCGEFVNLEMEELQKHPVEELVRIRNYYNPGSYTWQLLQCFMDRGRRLNKREEIPQEEVAA